MSLKTMISTAAPPLIPRSSYSCQMLNLSTSSSSIPSRIIITTPTLACSFQFHHNKRSTINNNNNNNNLGRDRVIDFGKYKGKMLGSLPSSYLKWVSKNLRAGDWEEWARLADEVLSDPIYKDRMEWELAEKVLNGHPSSRGSSAVSELVEISLRFGWDNEDKIGWSKIDFGLLGTSKGGRIPRLLLLTKRDDGSSMSMSMSMSKKNGDEEEERGKRKERRERMRMRRQQGEDHQYHHHHHHHHHGEFGNPKRGDEGEEKNPIFPGREALLKYIL